MKVFHLLIINNRWVTHNVYKKWHLQSRMIGIGEIFVGYRDTDDILRSSEWIGVDELVARVNGWDPQTNFDKGSRILNSLRAFCHAQMAVRRDDDRVWMVEICNGQGSGVPVSDGVFVRDLTVDERASVACRKGNRIGIIAMSVVEELRSAS